MNKRQWRVAKTIHSEFSIIGTAYCIEKIKIYIESSDGMIIESDIPFLSVVLQVMTQVIPLILESESGYIMLKCKWVGIGEFGGKG